MKEPLKLSVGDRFVEKPHLRGNGLGSFTGWDGYPAAMFNLWAFNLNSRIKVEKSLKRL